MADLGCNIAGVRSPNPFWLASAPPTDKQYNVERAFAAGWGGVVWKTLGEAGPPIVNVCSRYGSVDYNGQRMIGLNNIELITDRPLEGNALAVFPEASGIDSGTMQRIARELNLSAPLICYQGALIREPGDGDVLWHKPLPASLARKVLNEIRDEGLHRYAYIDGSIYVEQRREDDLRYARQNGVELHLVDDLAALVEREPTEIAARGDMPQIDSLLARLRTNCGPDVIVNKIHTSFCEIAQAGSGKGNALKYLSGMLGVAQDETVAIGDSPNDISMLEWAGLGIVVGDAPAEVRAAADWVVHNGAQDDFCEAIERLLDDGDR